MYYKYRPKKKDRTLLKRVVVILIFAAFFYAIYSYRDMLMFWKMDQNEIYKSIKKTVAIEDKAEKETEFKELEGKLEIYVRENLLESDALCMSAVFYYELFRHQSRLNFSEIYVNNNPAQLKKYEKILYKVMKSVKKACALNPKEDMAVEFRMILAKASYYLAYDRMDYIYEFLKKIDRDSNALTVDDIRFISVILINYGEYDSGLSLLKSKGDVERDVLSRIFYSRALCEAKKYTEAIVALKKLLPETKEVKDQILVLSCLGKVYFNQNLMKEAAEQFEKVLKIDPVNLETLIMLGKSYMQSGYKDRAREVWGRAYKLAPGNSELQELALK